MVERQNAMTPLPPRLAVHAVLTPLAMRARYGAKCSIPRIFSAPPLLNLRQSSGASSVDLLGALEGNSAPDEEQTLYFLASFLMERHVLHA
jgi:hypothetical protein